MKNNTLTMEENLLIVDMIYNIYDDILHAALFVDSLTFFVILSPFALSSVLLTLSLFLSTSISFFLFSTTTYIV